MATIPVVSQAVGQAARLTYVAWTPLTFSGLDAGEPIGPFPGADRSVQVFGTFGAGGTLVIEGSNDLTSPTNWATLVDPQGNALSFTAAKIEQVLEKTLWLRPRVTAGDATTSLTVKMLVGG